MRVLDLQGIESPFHQLKIAAESFFALRQLQTPPQPEIAILLQHRQHVGMKIGMPAAASGDGQRKPDQAIAVESADHLAADLERHHEHAQGNQVKVRKIPHRFLQRNASRQLRIGGAVADFDGLCRHRGGVSLPWPLDCCHSASISSRVQSSGRRFCARSCCSINSKRRRNLRLVRLSADSGSSDK